MTDGMPASRFITFEFFGAEFGYEHRRKKAEHAADYHRTERCNYRSDNHLEHAVFALYFARKAVVYVGFPLFAEYELKEAYPSKGRHAFNYQEGKYRDNRDYTQSRGKCE